MKVSTKYFNQTQIDTFGKMNKEIQKVQERISSGRNIVRASDDPVTAVKLSAAKEQRNLLDRFERNASPPIWNRHLQRHGGTMRSRTRRV